MRHRQCLVTNARSRSASNMAHRMNPTTTDAPSYRGTTGDEQDRFNAGATPIDRLFQLGYILAYRLLVIWWFFTHPSTEGAICAVWHRGRVLLVRSPYRPYFSFPGGFVNRGETGVQAAARELGEEVGISLPPDRLTFVRRTEEHRERRLERTQIFEIELASEPDVKIDHREIIAAAFRLPSEALALDLLPPVRNYIVDKIKPANIEVDGKKTATEQ